MIVRQKEDFNPLGLHVRTETSSVCEFKFGYSYQIFNFALRAHQSPPSSVIESHTVERALETSQLVTSFPIERKKISQNESIFWYLSVGHDDNR
jgi:hypothetical protein